jgi:hypothetical protein
MRLWRSKKMSQEAGRLTQVCVWAPEQDAEFVRELCTRVAEPTERGSTLRSVLRKQLNRRRTIYAEWSGTNWKAEIDCPFIGPWWFMRNIGGRVTGPDGTHVELSPQEAETLMDRLRRTCEKEIESWTKEQNLAGVLRDDTGVVVAPQQYRLSGDKNTAPIRPADDTEFAANEAKISRSILEAAVAHRQPPFKDPSVFEYEGFHGVPSFCQIVHRQHQGRVQFALIHMPNGGTSPTNMAASLATLLRQQFYPKIDPGLIDWFDVVPPHAYNFHTDLTIHPIAMRHANGVYSDPDWDISSSDNLPEDWEQIIRDTIVRGQKARDFAFAAPHTGP